MPGDRDCMDWSDEYFYNNGNHCPFITDTIECDEHLCRKHMYSCGDGECVEWVSRMAFQRLIMAGNDCFSKRNLNYMCEVSPHQRAWTLENGLCWPDRNYDDRRYLPWNITDLLNLSNQEKCDYLFRCMMSDNFEHDCPCHHLNCTQIMINICTENDQWIFYPPPGLITANVIIGYKYREYKGNTSFQFFGLGGGLKCRGFFSQTKGYLPYQISLLLIASPHIHQVLCLQGVSNFTEKDYISPFQIDRFCWKDSLTFNGRPYAVLPDVCTSTGECISQYRLRDGSPDCLSEDDENIALEKSYCTGDVGRQRFQCYNDEHKCLTSQHLGTGIRGCSNSYDETRYGNGLPIQKDITCSTNGAFDCYRVKDYIRQSSVKNSSRDNSTYHPERQYSTSRIDFRSYCDSFWDSDIDWDELPSSCQYWICQADQYRCQTGQCIKFEWLCDGEWDCADASDEEAVFLIREWSAHNARLSNLSPQLDRCRQRYSQSPFSTICNVPSELGCYRSRVANSLDISLNRPCINLTQIGDGVEDCYNAYDEKNTFTAKSSVGGMWGFHLKCGNYHKTYTSACDTNLGNNCTNILCSSYRDTHGSCSGVNDFICLEDNRCNKNARCNGMFDCSYGEDEYLCPTGSPTNRDQYRLDKIIISKEQIVDISLIKYPKESIVFKAEQQIQKSIHHLENNQLFSNHSFMCNRGITVLHMNETQCLCPPSYYGSRCQFFSDRLTVIVHLDRQNLPKSMSDTTLKIQVSFLFSDDILIDQHDFYLLPILETAEITKHKFYLLYSRSDSMIKHKQNRYLNRADIITNHPYAVHFILFALKKNKRPEELGAWHYPIYFDYLPTFRLAIVLKFPSWFQHSSFNLCQSSHCNKHSTCLPIFNQNKSSYCSCLSGYYNTDCSMYEPLCNTHCASNAFCQPKTVDQQGKATKPLCLCPLSHFGSRCNLKYDQCDHDSCLNKGACHLSYDRSGEQPFLCICANRFYGSRCQYEKASVRVQLNMTMTLSARAAVVQLYNILPTSLTLQIRHQKVYQGLPSTITYYHPDVQAPHLGIVKTYHDSVDPQYFVIYILNQLVINITSTPQHCSHVSALLPKGNYFRTKIYPSQLFFQILIDLSRWFFNTIGSVKMTLNHFVSMIKIICAFANLMSFVLNVSTMILNLTIVTNAFREEIVFKVIQLISVIFCAFAHLVIQEDIVNSTPSLFHSLLINFSRRIFFPIADPWSSLF